MLGYYLGLAVRRVRQNAATYLVVVVVLGLGVGIAMVMQSIVNRMTGDPVPERSSHLYRPYLDVRPSAQRTPGGESTLLVNLTWPDARELIRQGQRWRQAAMAGGRVTVTDQRDRSFHARARYATEGIFDVLDIPWLTGRGWNRQEDRDGQRVAVLAEPLAVRLCGGSSCVGQHVIFNARQYRVIGVTRAWRPVPMYHADLPGSAFADGDEVYLPLQTAIADDLFVDGGMVMWGELGDDVLSSPSAAWLQLWAHLPTADDVTAYQTLLQRYSEQQLGESVANGYTRLWPLMDWLKRQSLVPDDTRVQLWLAYLLLGTCIVNASALLFFSLDKRRYEMGVRRALGARRSDVFMQMMLEGVLVGIASGVMACLVYSAGLIFVAEGDALVAAATEWEANMLVWALLIGTGAAVVCASVPAYRICSGQVVTHEIGSMG